MPRVAIALATVLALAITANSALARPPARAASGQTFSVSGKPGKASYYLSLDGRRSIADVRLIGPSKSKVTVPAMAPGSYRLLTCTGGHCTAAPGRITVASGAPTEMVAFSDSRPLSGSTDDSDQSIAAAAGLNPALCPTPVSPRQLPPLNGALDAADKLLAQAAGAKGMAAFKASPVYRSAAAAEAGAAEAIAVKEPGAALAALLRAHDLEPNEPRYLVGAAAILTSLDHPTEALALIEAADKMAPSRSAPFGINVQALALNAKGVALLSLGRFDDAETYLRAAIDIDPLLAEAKVNLSIVLMCKQKQPDAMRFLRAGLHRQATINSDGSVTLPKLEDQLDLTHGQQLTLPPLPLPGSFREAQGANPLYVSLDNAWHDRFTAKLQRDTDLRNEGFAHPDSLLTQRRALDIVIASWPPEIQAAETELLKQESQTFSNVLALEANLQNQRTSWNSAASTACNSIYQNPQRQQCMDRVYDEHCQTPLEQAHQQVVDWVRAQEKADHEYLNKLYPYATAVLANISNPVTQERWLVNLELKVDHFYVEQYKTLLSWTHFAQWEPCGHAPGSFDAPGQEPTMPRPEACPPSVRGVKLSWKFEAVAVDINCEKVSVEASATVQGWIGVFGQLDWSPRSGKMTVFAGPKASAKIPGTSIGASFKDGLYVQLGRDGYLADFGFRTSVSGGAGFGPFSIKGGESMDFSFAPVFGMAR